MNIRYYGYKVNLYLLNNFYLEVFVNHKLAAIEKIQLLDTSHSRMKFYSDQIKLPQELLIQS
jgi:phosphatidate phosphatase PAH1